MSKVAARSVEPELHPEVSRAETSDVAFFTKNARANTLDEISPSDLDERATAEVEELAKVYQCRPDELVRAVGRQLLRVDGKVLPVREHRDVFALEAVARVAVTTGYSVGELADLNPADLNPDETELALVGHIRHIQTCDLCLAGVAGYLKLYPRRDDVLAIDI